MKKEQLRRDLYYLLSRFYPRKYKRHFAEVLKFGGDALGLRLWLGSGMLLALLFSLIPLLYGFLIAGAHLVWFLVSVAAFFAGHVLVYLFAHFQMEDRTSRIEIALPDFLQLMAANVRAGMTPFRAMKLSAREEFGPLKEEIEYATNKALGTESFAKSLLHVKDRVRSDTLDRALELLSSSLKSGGKLALLLEDLAAEIGEMQALRRDMVTATKSYSMFIFFMVLVGAPLLLAISVQFLSTLTGLSAGGVADGGLVGDVGITVSFFIKVAVIFLLLTSVLSSVLMGVIREGKWFWGLRYSPLIAVGSISLFFILKTIVAGFVG